MKQETTYEVNEKRILTALGEIDDQYIEEAEDIKKPHIKSSFPMIAAAALIAAVALFAFLRLLPAGPDAPGTKNSADPASDGPSSASGLPLLTARFDTETGMGFEGMMYYDISEAENGNPWTEEQALSSLPVYRNRACTDMGGITVFLNEDEMSDLAARTADALAASIENTTYQRISDITEQPPAGYDGTEAYSLTAETALGEITVYGNGQIRIFFSEPVTLPEEYRFTSSETTDDEAGEILRYLTGRYQALCAFDQPAYCTGGDYTYSGERIRFYQAYDSSGDLTQQILNYNFNNISFSPDDDGNLFIIWSGDLLTAAEKIDDYPLIDAETARCLLLNGDYITTVPSEYLRDGTITEPQIAKTELVYRTGNTEELFMPYYRFYVKLTDYSTDMAEGLICYGAYYVPAVSGEYLSDFPVWGGRFN